VGEVVLNNTNNLIAGFNMIGSAYPSSGAIDTNLMLNPSVGDAVFVFVNGVGYNAANTYFGSGFWGGGNPVLSVGQGIFYNSVNAKPWAQSFAP
jgi:hypothetical protein